MVVGGEAEVARRERDGPVGRCMEMALTLMVMVGVRWDGWWAGY